MKSSKKDPYKVLTSQKMRKKHIFYAKENHRMMYLISLAILVIASIIGTLVMVPFLIFFSSAQVYIMITIAGVTFGLIFSFMMLDLQHLEQKHHILLGIIVPAIALANIYLMMNLTSRVADFFKIGIKHNPYLTGSFYLIGFVLPYLIMGWLDYEKHKK